MPPTHLAIAFCVFLLVGCAASGPKYKDVAATLPRLQKDHGRVYVLRDSSPWGAGVQPDILFDGKSLGKSRPGSFVFADARPGRHEVSTCCEPEGKLGFNLAAGEIKYVKTTVKMGVFTGSLVPELMRKEEAEKELPELAHIIPMK